MAIELHHLHPGHDDEVSRLKARIAELEAENENTRDALGGTTIAYKQVCDEYEQCDKELRATKRALWLMTAEWAEAMGLASCNIANKFMSRENFEVGDDYRNNTVKKYRHRQVVFYKYADYCRHKAEEYKQ